MITELFENISSAFSNKSFEEIKIILKDKNKSIGLLEEKIETQISRTRSSEEKKS